MHEAKTTDEMAKILADEQKIYWSDLHQKRNQFMIEVQKYLRDLTAKKRADKDISLELNYLALFIDNFIKQMVVVLGIKPEQFAAGFYEWAKQEQPIQDEIFAASQAKEHEEEIAKTRATMQSVFAELIEKKNRSEKIEDEEISQEHKHE